MRRGEIWTGAADIDYAGKPRPCVVIQDDRFEVLESVTICGFTRDPTDLPLFRIPIEPSRSNGLEFPCRIMIDKVLTIPKRKLGYRIGQLTAVELAQVDQALAVFLGLT